MSKIVVIGSSNADLVINTKKAPEGGETVMGESFAMNYGGKGANQAVAVQRIGGESFWLPKWETTSSVTRCAIILRKRKWI